MPMTGWSHKCEDLNSEFNESEKPYLADQNRNISQTEPKSQSQIR